MPPIRVATTGRAFHIPSATVRPNPSRLDFWSTASDCDWKAFTSIATGVFPERIAIGHVDTFLDLLLEAVVKVVVHLQDEFVVRQFAQDDLVFVGHVAPVALFFAARFLIVLLAGACLLLPEG